VEGSGGQAREGDEGETCVLALTSSCFLKSFPFLDHTATHSFWVLLCFLLLSFALLCFLAFALLLSCCPLTRSSSPRSLFEVCGTHTRSYIWLQHLDDLYSLAHRIQSTPPSVIALYCQLSISQILHCSLLTLLDLQNTRLAE